MAKRSYNEIANTQCGTCVAIAAVHNDLQRMTQLLSNGVTSMFIYWPREQLNLLGSETIESQILPQIRMSSTSKQPCDHFILENIPVDDLHLYKVFESRIAPPHSIFSRK